MVISFMLYIKACRHFMKYVWILNVNGVKEMNISRLDAVLYFSCSVHGAAKNFVCNTCGKAFVTKSDNDRHERRHAELAITCDICGQKTATRHEMSQHIHNRRRVLVWRQL